MQRLLGGEVLIVTSMIGGSKVEQLKVKEAEENLEKVKKYFDDNGVACTTHLLVRGLDAGDDIVNFANEKGVDEIIIGVKSRSKVGKLLFGSTAQAVILQAVCPVLSVK